MSFMKWMPYIWTAALLLSFIIEAATAELLAIWFAPGAIVSLVLSILNVPIWIQVTVFFLLSLVTLIVAKRLLQNWRERTPRAKTNTDLLIGQKAVVTEEINLLKGTGEVRVSGQLWSARPLDEDRVFPVGDIVSVEEIRGVKIIVN